MPTYNKCRQINNTLLKETSSKHLILTVVDFLSFVAGNKRIEEEALNSEPNVRK